MQCKCGLVGERNYRLLPVPFFSNSARLCNNSNINLIFIIIDTREEFSYLTSQENNIYSSYSISKVKQ
jgi:hypothetical protein